MVEVTADPARAVDPGRGVEPPPVTEAPAATDRSAGPRRRFTVAALTGWALVTIPYLLVLWGPWETPNPFRKTQYEANFYELQARAMLHGHLYVPDGSIGIEAFRHGGHQYTYFGILLSVLRMPVILFTHSLDARMTAPSMLVAWLLTGLFSVLLLWRVRLFLHGAAVMGRAEAVSYGAVVATIMGGSTVVYLAATPYVFNEDLAWSIALTVGGLFAILGVLERPSGRRILATFVLVLAANLDRLTTGWACAAAAVATAVWLWAGRGGPDNRRWAWPMLAAGVVPVAAGCAVNMIKFGVPFGLPVADQLWSSINHHRQLFLAANHNSEVGTAFLPSDALAYLRPDGLRLTSVFPFVTLPARPAPALLGVLFDRRYRTASMPSSMPLLFLLACWGAVTALRPKPVGRIGLTRIPLVAAGAAAAALLLWGYIGNRYLADFVPLLVVGSAVGLADIWRRLGPARTAARVASMAVVVAAAAFTIAANFGIAVEPNEEWSTTQTLNFVQTEHAVSDVTGHPLDSLVSRRQSLPVVAPADRLVVVGDCDGLYVSTGEDFRTVPTQEYQRANWLPVQRGPAFERFYTLAVGHPSAGPTVTQRLVSLGSTAVSLNTVRDPRNGRLRIWFSVQDARAAFSGPGDSTDLAPGTSHQVVLVTDPVTHQIVASIDGVAYSNGQMSGRGRTVVYRPGAPAAASGVSVADTTGAHPGPALCRSLVRGR